MPPSQIRELLLSRADIGVLRELVRGCPRRIVSDDVGGFFFDSGTRHLAAMTIELVPLSQNNNDEAFAVRPFWHDGPCAADGRPLFENACIEDVRIVRSLVWFTDHIQFRSEEHALADMPSPRNESERALHDLLRGSTGGHEECVSNPNLATEIAAPVANLVDVGFIAVVGGRALACFAQCNCYLREADFLDELRHDFQASYELISLDEALQRAV